VTTEVTSTYLYKTKWFATATARLGYSWGPALIYVKGGAAWVRNELETNTHVANLTIDRSRGSETRLGWTIGAGLEYLLTPNWSLFAEYNYMDMGSNKASWTTDGLFIVVPSDVEQNLHVVKTGLNFRFGGQLDYY
jgi:outer membrane immunogenic protein